ncbi:MULTISPECIES: hypothetical protein [unclassified Corallococcus]|uniref:hypothetical protein n=1 Tax=unclassified Corallococcus TaxID=2685029 RepID=UPI001A904947|nr:MULTISPECIES: hypothetical protein [unclassified Corallococcus]MBN9682640.1 hypothetical protein [Corallococcus sp. NCSPR001]WAS85815.1 hypothetical protein O0N60_02310 [Corallococcus sp. NCRR]
MSPSREASASPGLRHWATRLILLVACASVVATSGVTSGDVVSEPYTSAPLTLTTEAPKLTRPITVKVTVPKASSRTAEADLTVEVKARWTPADPTGTTQPWMRVSLARPGENGSRPARSVVLEAGTEVRAQTPAYLDPACQLGTGCEWATELTVELQPDAAGTVELEWTGVARARVLDTSDIPAGMAVSVSEP